MVPDLNHDGGLFDSNEALPLDADSLETRGWPLVRRHMRRARLTHASIPFDAIEFVPAQGDVAGEHKSDDTSLR